MYYDQTGRYPDKEHFKKSMRKNRIRYIFA